MAKNVLKIAFFALLFVSILLVPFVGVEFYESDSIFDEGAIYCDHDFGEGKKVTIDFKADEGSDLTVERAAEVLENRFSEYGFLDTVVEASDGKLIVSLPMQNGVEDIIKDVAVVGNWNLTDMSGEEIINKDSVEDSHIEVASNGYYVAAEIKEDMKDSIKSKVAYAATSGSPYAFLNLDGTIASYCNMSKDAYSDGSVLIGPFDYSSAARTSSLINNGELNAEFKIASVEDYSAKFTGGARTAIYVVSALIVVALAAVIALKDKKYGIGAAVALISNAAVVLTALANASFVFNMITLIGMVLAIAVSFAINYFAINKINSENDTKANVFSIFSHLAIFVVTVILWMTTRGNVFNLARIFMVTSVASFCTYFIFTYALGKFIKNNSKQ